MKITLQKPDSIGALASMLCIVHSPQVQERLSLQILRELQDKLDTKDVIVMISAKHLCVSSRGIKDKNSLTTTIEYGGCFENENIRKDFFTIVEGENL